MDIILAKRILKIVKIMITSHSFTDEDLLKISAICQNRIDEIEKSEE